MLEGDAAEEERNDAWEVLVGRVCQRCGARKCSPDRWMACEKKYVE
jgi:hypothetical protein